MGMVRTWLDVSKGRTEVKACPYIAAPAGQAGGPPTTRVHHETATIGPAFGGALAALRAANMLAVSWRIWVVGGPPAWPAGAAT